MAPSLIADWITGVEKISADGRMGEWGSIPL
jgi:hypothetical protein